MYTRIYDPGPGAREEACALDPVVGESMKGDVICMNCGAPANVCCRQCGLYVVFFCSVVLAFIQDEIIIIILRCGRYEMYLYVRLVEQYFITLRKAASSSRWVCRYQVSQRINVTVIHIRLSHVFMWKVCGTSNNIAVYCNYGIRNSKEAKDFILPL